MRTAIYVLTALIIVLGGVAAALWLSPASGVKTTSNKRFGLHEGLELVEKADAQGRTHYVVEDRDGQKLFDIPVRNCLLDTRFREGKLRFRENATGRTGYIDPRGTVTFLSAEAAPTPEQHTRERTVIRPDTAARPVQSRASALPRPEAQPHRLENEDLRRLKADHPFYKEAAKVVSGKLEENDAARRRVILNYCEHFRMAYNTKDIDFLRQVFSEQALIIVGNVVKAAQEDGNNCTASKRVEYYLRTKSEYLSRLSHAFAGNEKIDVKFSDFRILRHPTQEGIYGVSLRQRYQSDRYADDGWLFLLWDFRNASMPLIHVRTWQPSSDVRGTDELINMSDFNLN